LAEEVKESRLKKWGLPILACIILTGVVIWGIKTKEGKKEDEEAREEEQKKEEQAEKEKEEEEKKEEEKKEDGEVAGDDDSNIKEQDWFKKGEKIKFDGASWKKASRTEFLSDDEVERKGSYKGVPLFIKAGDMRPYGAIYIKIDEDEYQVYENNYSEGFGLINTEDIS